MNSLLQRARAQLDAVGPSVDDPLSAPDSPEARDQLARYISAFEDYDIERLVEMFTAEAVWEMPPFVGWYQGGPRSWSSFTRSARPRRAGDMRLLPLTANGQPAAAMYMRLPETDGRHVPFQLHVLDVSRVRCVACRRVPRHQPVREIRPARGALALADSECGL